MPALFYHVTQSPVEGVVETLLTRALAQGWRVELRGVSPERMDWLDQKLWLGPEEDFLPHGLAGGPHDALQPVLLTPSPRPEGRQAVMTLAGAEVTPAEVAAAERVWILFDGRDETAVARARDQGKERTGAGTAAQEGSEESGRWQKKEEK